MMRACRLLLCWLLLAGCAIAARADGLAEYRLKAAFLYNFVTFTEWPATVGASLVLCVHGPDPFGADLDKLQGKQVGERVLAVRRAGSIDELAGCQAVFVTRAAMGNLKRAVESLAEQPVLIVADSPDAMQHGAMLNIVPAGNKLGFEANLAAARAHGLQLSAQLLQLATEVRR